MKYQEDCSMRIRMVARFGKKFNVGSKLVWPHPRPTRSVIRVDVHGLLLSNQAKIDIFIRIQYCHDEAWHKLSIHIQKLLNET